MKSPDLKKHNKVLKNYELNKERKLEQLATKLLKDAEKAKALEGKKISPDFFDLF